MALKIRAPHHITTIIFTYIIITSAVLHILQNCDGEFMQTILGIKNSDDTPPHFLNSLQNYENSPFLSYMSYFIPVKSGLVYATWTFNNLKPTMHSHFCNHLKGKECHYFLDLKVYHELFPFI